MKSAVPMAFAILFGTFVGLPTVAQTPTPLPDFLIDLDRDGAIDSQDLLILIRRWGLQGIATPSPTQTHTLSPTPSSTNTSPPPPTETFTSTPSPSLTETPTPSSTQTPTSTVTPTSTSTATPTITDTPSPTETPTNPSPLTLELPGPTFSMVLIPAGSFMMGSPATERGRDANEGPVHQVTIAYDFYMGETEVTQGQWEAVMGSRPAQDYGEGNDYPVYNVSWDDCQAFLVALNALGQGSFRLPSEAEWEYASRAGSTTRFYFGDSLGCADGCENCDAAKGPVIIVEKRSDFMWYCGSSEISTHPVRQLFPNTFGLYDMSGNVFEWCQDFYRSDYDFAGIPIDGSAWESGGGDGTRVIRGGGWSYDARFCRSADRGDILPDFRFGSIGFRLARTP